MAQNERKSCFSGLILASACIFSALTACPAADGDFYKNLAACKIDWPEYILRASHLIREPAVQRELHLLPGAQARLPMLCDDLDPPLFALRHTGPQGIHPNMRGAYENLRKSLTKTVSILDAAQRQRLMQLTLQSMTVAALDHPEMAAEIGLTDQQRDVIHAINDQLNQKLYGSAETTPLKRRLLHREAQQKIMQQLAAEQRRQWHQMRGDSFDLAQLEKRPLKAPQLIDTGQWLNGGPISLTEIRGTVVLVHFYTYGCVNCINNYPWYKKWYDQYNGRGVKFIGIHTPETDGERNIDSVRTAAEKNGLEFPILIDNDMENWRAWGNDMWPSLYLIDKQGRVRYWWYGELDWQERNGQEFIQQRIDRLLAE